MQGTRSSIARCSSALKSACLPALTALTLAASAFIAPVARAGIDTPVLWYASHGPHVWLNAQQQCVGDQCDRCANNVVGQFNAVIDGQRTKTRGAWYVPEGSFEPSGRGRGAFDSDFEWLSDNWDGHHIQGFVKTPTGYAIANGDDGGGVVALTAGGTASVVTHIYNHATEHSAPLGSVGSYIMYRYTSNRVAMIDVLDPDAGEIWPAKLSVTVDAPRGINSAGGGIDAVELFDGTHLVAARDNEDGTFLYRVHDLLSFANDEFVGKMSTTGFTLSDEPQNLSLITECGTGTIYMVETGGGGTTLNDGWWALSRVEADQAGKPVKRRLGQWSQDQDVDYCYHRSAATVSTGSRGELVFTCSSWEGAMVTGLTKFTEYTVNGFED